jgi:hypothetical protein
MSKVYLFDFDDLKICIDLDTVSMITFRESQIRIVFKGSTDISEFDFSKNIIHTKEFYNKLIDFWMS